MSLKAKIEAIIYAAEEPVTLAQLITLLGPDLEQALEEQDAAAAQPELPIPDETVEVLAPTVEEGGTETFPGAVEAAPQDAETSPVAETPAPAKGEAQAQEEANAEVAAETASEAPAEPAAAESEPLLVDEKKLAQQRERRLRDYLKAEIAALMENYEDRGVYITEVASGFRMSTRPEYHDVIRDFAKSLKPALKLSLPALETLAVIAYKQPVTAAEVSEIRGVDSAGVLGGLMTRKLITTAGRKQVIGRPILYKTTKEFLLRFGLKDTSELPSIEEFEKMAGELAEQEDLPMEINPNPEGTPNPDVEPQGAGEETPETPVPEPQADGSGESVEDSQPARETSNADEELQTVETPEVAEAEEAPASVAEPEDVESEEKASAAGIETV
ncbi:SMC-Scp complex subunit ScpB [Terriglobus albidus]|uniref:SMC-Scp complex subunit ScpB n=1 Tax=Terriglobus albidus TaxID=1592106 RepID=A0A5B9E2Y3_9BACT|nr:SMC-Scp complex subunit ScpB [Terriglobus albidus]QEE26672.1 SMC-Scp complex subunit ScpB [Terriglobus albidus]